MYRIVFRGLLILMLIAVTAPGFAQEAVPESQPEDAPEQVTGEGLVFKDQIVVTPGRQEQASGDLPAPITVFDRETIEKIQPEKMAEKRSPGWRSRARGLSAGFRSFVA